MKKILIIGGAILLVIILIIGYTGFFPAVSDLMGTNKPMDLGVSYSKQDYFNALSKAGFSLDNSAGLGPDTRIVYEGEKNIDAEFTQEEVSAILSYDHADEFPVRDVQVKINNDGTMEASALVKLDDYKGISLNNAVYVKGKLELSAPNHVSIKEVDKLVVGRVPVPANDEIIRKVEQGVNDKLNSIPGLYITSVEIEEGKGRIKGTIPASAKRIVVQ